TLENYELNRVRVLILGYYSFNHFNKVRLVENFEDLLQEGVVQESDRSKFIEENQMKHLEGVKQDVEQLEQLFNERFAFDVARCIDKTKDDTETFIAKSKCHFSADLILSILYLNFTDKEILKEGN